MAEVEDVYRLDADVSDFTSGMVRAQQAARSASTGITVALTAAAEKAAQAAKAVSDAAAEYSRALVQGASSAATTAENAWQGAIEGATQAAKSGSLALVTGVLGVLGPGGRFAASVVSTLSAPFEAAFERVTQIGAGWVQRFTASIQAALQALAGWAKDVFGVEVDVSGAGAGIDAALQRIEVGSRLTGATDKVDAAADADALAARVAGLRSEGETARSTAGAIARLTAEHQILRAMGVQSLNDLTEAQRAYADEVLKRREESAQARADAEDEVRRAERYRQAVQAITTSLQRQSEMERLAAESVTLTAEARARARAIAEARAAGRGAGALEAPEVQAGIETRAREAAANALTQVQVNTAKALNDQNAALALQTQSVGANAGELARLTFIHQRLQDAERAGVPVTAELRATWERMGQQLSEAAQRAAEARERFQHLQEIGRTVAGSLTDAFSKFMDGTKLSWKEFINDLAKDLARLEFRQLMTALFGGSQANPVGIIGSLLGFGGARAEGGPVSAGKSYVVGERGPEVFRPSGSGTIVPNSALGGGGSSTINMRINLEGVNGNDTIARISAQAARAAAVAAVEKSNAMLGASQHSLRMLSA